MIRIEDKLIILETAGTQYLMAADGCGHLLHLHYGKKLHVEGDPLKAMLPRVPNQNGCSIIADPEEPNLCLDDALLEVSFRGKGDMREPFLELTLENGSSTSDFRYVGAVVTEGDVTPDGLPGAWGAASTVTITMLDRNSPAKLELFYSVYEDADTITRFARLTNGGDAPITVQRFSSAQLDLEWHAARVTAFHGDWTREMGRHDLTLQGGKWVNDSSTGFSSNQANPFIMLSAPDATETAGECYAENLIYSGCHRETVEINAHGCLRLTAGINPDLFSWRLGPGESIDCPEAALTWSDAGYTGISQNMHAFVREHIVRGSWAKKPRPVLVNSWEAMYFKISEGKLLHLAETAAKAGIELFVLDDGWFGHRDNDQSSLGDWAVDTKKLPNGLKGLSEKIQKLGMQFGIWVEPEMVSRDSDLYRAHPDWAVCIPEMPHAEGRNQMLLDLTRDEVCSYVTDSMARVFTEGQVSYVKWDMNRHFSDFFSSALPAKRQGEFSYRYIRGLYRILDKLTKRFPNILFEGCASGGNRFDLGMLCYMPQVWASDCTDPICRTQIQNGYSFGYPQSVMGAHVSSSPNHQTLRKTSLNTRFTVAAAGILGYECNLCDASSKELDAIREQVALYKQWREVLQTGDLYRLAGGKLYSPANAADSLCTDLVQWVIVSKDRRRAVAFTVQGETIPNYSHRSLKLKGLDPERMYHFYNIPHDADIRVMGDLINTASPIHIAQGSLLQTVVAQVKHLDGDKEDMTVSGSVLMGSGIRLAPRFAGTGFGENTAVYQDYDARMYFIEAAE